MKAFLSLFVAFACSLMTLGDAQAYVNHCYIGEISQLVSSLTSSVHPTFIHWVHLPDDEAAMVTQYQGGGLLEAPDEQLCSLNLYDGWTNSNFGPDFEFWISGRSDYCRGRWYTYDHGVLFKIYFTWQDPADPFGTLLIYNNVWPEEVIPCHLTGNLN